jgi:hypothetical protein
MRHDRAGRELQSAARETEEAKIAREDEEMRRIEVIQSERQVLGVVAASASGPLCDMAVRLHRHNVSVLTTNRDSIPGKRAA